MRRIFLGGQVISMIGDGLALLAVPLLILRLTHDPLAAGLAVAMRSVGYLAVGAPAGPDSRPTQCVAGPRHRRCGRGRWGGRDTRRAHRAAAGCPVRQGPAGRYDHSDPELTRSPDGSGPFRVEARAAAKALLIFASSQGGLLARSIRQELVARVLGRVTAVRGPSSCRLPPSAVRSPGGGTRVAGNVRGPMFLGAGCLLDLAIAVAWFGTLRPQVAIRSSRCQPRRVRRPPDKPR